MSLLLSSRSGSSSPRILSSSMPRKFSSVVSPLLLSVRAYDTSYSEVWQSEGEFFILILFQDRQGLRFCSSGPAMVSFDLSWNLVPKVVKLLCLESFVQLVQNR